jgi:hypothetical protein
MKINHQRKLNKNPAALVAALLVLLSGFLFQLFYTVFLDTAVKNTKLTMMGQIMEIYRFNLPSSPLSISIVLLIIVFITIFLFYALNGFGIIYNRYSRYASYFSFVYLILGLFIYTLLNQNNYSLFGLELTSMSIGPGIYFIPIIGALYLFFKRSINSVLHI